MRPVAEKKEAWDLFQKQFRCRLQFFQYTARNKNARQRKVLAEKEIKLNWDNKDPQTVQLVKMFTNPKPGSNFSFGLGLGVALLIEMTGAKPVTVSQSAGVAVHQFEVSHSPKPRNDKVTV